MNEELTERLELLNENSSLKMDLKRRINKLSEIDRRSKAIYEKFVRLSHDIVDFIVANGKMEGKSRITTDDEIQQFVESVVIKRPVLPEELGGMIQLLRQRTDETTDNQPSPEEREEGAIVAMDMLKNTVSLQVQTESKMKIQMNIVDWKLWRSICCSNCIVDIVL